MRRHVGPVARIAAVAITLSGLAGCVPPQAPPGVAAKPELSLTAVAFADLPGWAQDHPAEAVPGFLAGCRQLADAASTHTLGGQGQAATLGGNPQQWQPACAAAAQVPPGDDAAARAFFAARSSRQPKLHRRLSTRSAAWLIGLTTLLS